ncbi:hypothetical protein QCA50_011558 [Cerrena zonata]|uniref:DUF6533 domain-containing protein n=1 Tax=Cerrena zonata TaxID=2478898 RepID=A0AAW0G859_9APHY
MSVEQFQPLEIGNLVTFRYIHVAVATAWVWDALVSCSTEVDAFLGRKLALVDLVYFSSRILTFFVVVSEVIAVVVPLGNYRCNIIVHVLSALGTLTTCLCTFLFLVRARSVFFESKRAGYAFTILWFLAVTAVLSTTPFSFYGTGVRPSGLCAVSRVGPTEAVGSISVAVFDTVAFTSISLRVLSLDGRVRSGWAMFKAFIIPSNAGPVSKALLRTGQLYFFPIMMLLACVLTFEFSSFVQAALLLQCRSAAYLAIAVFYNIMACRVFRLLRLVVPPTAQQSTEVSHVHFRQFWRGDESTYRETRIEVPPEFV